jgi:chaperone modulatory protein CbpM
MTDTLTEDDVIATITWLTRQRLDVFIDARLIVPVQTETGRMYGPVDLARLELLCDLAEQFDLAEDALGIVISLIDALHAARSRLHRVAEALDAEPADVRQRVGARLMTASGHDQDFG